MNKKELVNAVSKDCLLSHGVVEDVIDSLKGVMIEELVKSGKTTFPGVVSIKSIWRDGYLTPLGEVPAQEVLKVRISRTLRDVFRYFGPSTGKSSFIDAKNWREFLKWARTERLERERKKIPPTGKLSEEASLPSLQEQFDELLH